MKISSCEFTSFWAENDISHLIIFWNLIRWNNDNIEIFSVFSHNSFDCALNDKNFKNFEFEFSIVDWETLGKFPNVKYKYICTIGIWPLVPWSTADRDRRTYDTNLLWLLLFLVARNNDWSVVWLFNFWNITSVCKRKSRVASSQRRPTLVQLWHPLLSDCINNKGLLPWFEFINVAWRSGTK